MKSFARIAALLLAALLVIVAATFFWYRSATQPQVSGKLQMNGLQEAVDIVRDAEGIPHIYAKSAHDAFFALGVTHAQDRLWQMEMNRRIAAGRMAEVLGPAALDTDRFLRTLGVRRNAEAIVRNLAPDARAALDAYAEGVNRYLEQRSGPLPPEFLLTGALAPAPWEPADSIAWQTMMAWDLSANWTQELLRMRLAQRMDMAHIQAFLPPYPGDAPLHTQDYTSLYRSLAGTAAQLEKVSRIAPPSLVEGMGSNNWVLGSRRSATGKPLLANDPHLGLSAPALWYFAHLSAPGLNVIGATLPGVPADTLGHNDQIAWGLTNTAPDVQDLFIEQINPDNAAQYRTPDGWAAFDHRTETIRVKGQADVQLTVRETRHGPVITGALPLADRAPVDARTHVIAFAWTALRPDDLTYQASLRLNRARDWEQFLAAMRDFSAPQQNVVYADVAGNVGFIAPARVPVRRRDNDLKGLAPAPGWDARYDWTGFIPFDDLPREYNPLSQQIVTANQKIVGPAYSHFITSEWTLPYRAQRIASLLEAKPLHDMDSFATIQKDDFSLAARELLPLLARTAPKSDQARNALAALKQWDGKMDAARFEPLVYNAWMRELSRQLFAAPLGESLMKDYWEQRNIHQPTAEALRTMDTGNLWCSGASAGNGLPRCTEVLSASLDSALADLRTRYGDDMQAWKWGKAHEALSEHRPFSKVPSLAKYFDIRLPSPGDTYTVNVGRHNLRDEAAPFTNHHAASLRALYDLSNLENSRFIHSTGQSGNVFSPLYSNYAQRWIDVAYLPMRTVRAEVEKGMLGTLALTP
ncbi:penicillin acylase family protein [Noviherbaspirillum suwonense]|uniref:Penicillin amidase n=1 Tax=Noviherbaspirillum suwonense TaxID=1224511 RepID=A0ABY1PUF5_9BURK|nr:penicillin acylase family protein [Noviherbaspirillum suwonense]SMP48490.1 penicillin amidase [Noviherbaspirillum suwonense]